MANTHMAMACSAQGDFVEAARLYRETTYRTPIVHLIMATVHGELGNLEEARKELSLYTDSTTVPPDVMLNRAVHHAELRGRFLEGLKRASVLNS
jgi:hypothetical protein